MATKPPSRVGGLMIKIPEQLSVKDMITIVSVAVSLATAWGVFSTRLSLLEQEIVSLSGANKELKQEVKEMQTKMFSQELTVQELRNNLEHLQDVDASRDTIDKKGR